MAITDLEALRALQLERLRETLRRVYENVPHYRQAFDEAGVMPDDLETLGDLARFPFTTKEDLRANYPFGLFAVPREDVVRIHASSGTTGKPTVVGYTQRDVDTWAELVARSIEAAGGRRATSSTSSTGTGSSPAGSACTTAPSGSGARSCRCRAA
jgi:phenylacetate-CoA ligase